jgi:hypothetical protein
VTVADAWMRNYPTGHRARITKSFEATFSLEVFTTSGDRMLDFALLMPSLELAKETADFIINSQGEPWVPMSRESSNARIEELQETRENAQAAPTNVGSHTTRESATEPSLVRWFRGKNR